MPTCPICAKPLETARQRDGIYYPCQNCNGRAVTVSQVRRVLGDAVAMKLLRLMKLTWNESERHCPFCEQTMFLLHTESPPLTLDACKKCNTIWFDGPTYEAFPQITSETSNSIQLQATEIIAMDRLNELKKQMEEERKNAKKKKKLTRGGQDGDTENEHRTA